MFQDRAEGKPVTQLLTGRSETTVLPISGGLQCLKGL